MSDVKIPLEDKILLQDCTIKTFRSSGKGGQHANKTESAVRINHLPSGLSATCQEERSQFLNKHKCIQNLRKKLIDYYSEQPKRIPTKKPIKAKEKVLEAKHRQSIKKQLRKKINE